jgi:RNA polymerase sigma-70 factor, ECF subfamily
LQEEPTMSEKPGSPREWDRRELGADAAPMMRPSRETESKLIERAKNGDVQAFEELVSRNRAMLVSMLRNLCRNEADVEDLFQEVVLTLYLKLKMFEGKSSLATWLYRVARNTFLMHNRKAANGRFSFVPIASCEEPACRSDLFNSDEPPEAVAHVLRAEITPMIREAMSALPEGHREVILLRKVKGLSAKEVSSLMKISVPAVKSRQHRAKQVLKVQMEGLGMRNREWGFS